MDVWKLRTLRWRSGFDYCETEAVKVSGDVFVDAVLAKTRGKKLKSGCCIALCKKFVKAVSQNSVEEAGVGAELGCEVFHVCPVASDNGTSNTDKLLTSGDVAGNFVSNLVTEVEG